MHEALEQILFREAPLLYRQGLRDGFQCLDGWFLLLLDLSRQLESQCLEQKAKGQSLTAATQVKEKFGPLRFYVDHRTSAVSLAIEEACIRSGEICEHCGEPGMLHIDSHHWRRTLCRTHLQEIEDQS